MSDGGPVQPIYPSVWERPEERSIWTADRVQDPEIAPWLPGGLPDFPVPRQRAWVEEPASQEHETLVFPLVGGSTMEAPLPPEFYLRKIMRLDIHSRERVAEFVRAEGSLYGRRARAVIDGRIHTRILPSGGRQETYVGWEPPFYGPYVEEALWRNGAYEEIDRRLTVMLSEGADRKVELLSETTLALAIVRDATRVYEAFSTNRCASMPAEWDLSLFGVPKPKSDDDALFFLASSLNAALRHISYHLELVTSHGARIHPAVDDVWGPWAPLYPAIVAQLMNHVVVGASYHYCANEQCRGRFVYQQEGRARHGQQWTKNVRFCTRACASAQTQRNYRRRKRASTTAQEHG